jgi:hypothetical protein
MNEQQANGVGTISTRSRMGSMASAVSGTSQAPPEKRQTTAGDRAFLLGYLGRIASKEGWWQLTFATGLLFLDLADDPRNVH